MSSEQLGAAQNVLKGNLGGAWDINKGYQDAYTDLGVARRFGSVDAAYSLKDIGAMNGRVVRVRRDTGGAAGDDDEEDFTANQVISGALESFVGSGNAGYVVEWYDQSGNGNDATAPSDEKQPPIVESGSLITFNGNPCIKASRENSTNNHKLDIDSHIIEPYTFFGVGRSNRGSKANWFSKSGIEPMMRLHTSNVQADFGADAFGSLLVDGDVAEGALYTLFSASNTGNAVMRRNGVQVDDTSGGTNPISRTTAANASGVECLFSMKDNDPGEFLFTNLMIFFDGDKTSDFSAIENELMREFGLL